MDTPDPALEQKILREMLTQLEDPAKTARRQAAYRRGVTATGIAGLTTSLFLGMHDLVGIYAVWAIAATGGILSGFGIFLNSVQKQWPVTVHYVDLDRVRARLEALER